MSKSIYNALKFLEVGSYSKVYHVLHVQNKSQSQQNKLTVTSKAGVLPDYSVNLPSDCDYRRENLAERGSASTTVYLARSKPAALSVMRSVTISKLVYDYIAARLGGFYPPYESVNMQYSEGSAAFELTADPDSVKDADGNISFPIIFSIPKEDAELAMATLDPGAIIANERPVVSVRNGDVPWYAPALNQCLFKTPDGMYWLAFASVPQPAATFGGQQYNMRILLKSDGELSEALREATLYTINVNVLDPTFDPCAGATREVVMAVEKDMGPFDVIVNDTHFTFQDLNDFRVNAATRLPADITPKLMNKFTRPDISCAGATSSVFLNAKSTDVYDIVIDEVEHKGLTYTQMVNLLEANNCIVKRIGSSPQLSSVGRIYSFGFDLYDPAAQPPVLLINYKVGDVQYQYADLRGVDLLPNSQRDIYNFYRKTNVTAGPLEFKLGTSNNANVYIHNPTDQPVNFTDMCVVYGWRGPGYVSVPDRENFNCNFSGFADVNTGEDSNFRSELNAGNVYRLAGTAGTHDPSDWGSIAFL